MRSGGDDRLRRRQAELHPARQSRRGRRCRTCARLDAGVGAEHEARACGDHLAESCTRDLLAPRRVRTGGAQLAVSPPASLLARIVRRHRGGSASRRTGRRRRRSLRIAEPDHRGPVRLLLAAGSRAARRRAVRPGPCARGRRRPRSRPLSDRAASWRARGRSSVLVRLVDDRVVRPRASSSDTCRARSSTQILTCVIFLAAIACDRGARFLRRRHFVDRVQRRRRHSSGPRRARRPAAPCPA